MISLEEVLLLHDSLRDCGLLKFDGINNLNLLKSAIDGQYWFNTPFDALCHVSFSVNAYHCFRDGNKRTASLIILSSGLSFNIPVLTDVILSVADGRI